MADDGGMVGQSDVFGVMTPSTRAYAQGSGRTAGFLVNNESAFDIDLDRAGVDDGAINLGRVSSSSEGFDGCCGRIVRLDFKALGLCVGFGRHGGRRWRVCQQRKQSKDTSTEDATRNWP